MSDANECDCYTPVSFGETTPTTPAPMSNSEFGRRIGVTHSMASRVRAGKRLPGIGTMQRISSEFGIPIADLVTAHQAGPEAFAKLLRKWKLA